VRRSRTCDLYCTSLSTNPTTEKPRLPVKSDDLSDGQPPDARDCAVDPHVVLIGTNRCLQHFRVKAPVIRIDVHHRAADIPHGDTEGGCVLRFAESQYAAQPFILLEGHGAGGSDDDIRTKSPHVCASPGEAANLVNRIGGDHGDAGVVEDTVFQVHHLNGIAITAPELSGESFSEQGHLLPLRRENVCGQSFAISIFSWLRSEEDEIGQLTRGEPREPAAVVKPAKREASIAVEAVPAQRGGIEWLATHGLHRIAEERFNFSNLD